MKYYNNYADDKHIPESYDPQLEEKKVFEFWTKRQTVAKINENRRTDNDAIFSIHCGPPFPTGSPHFGHVLNSIIKDIFTRHANQKKLQVVSQLGWDCHGLPVEHEVDKKLGIKTHEGKQQIGVVTYNDECRKFVQRHQAEWKNIFERLGNCMDFTNTYSTMSQDYMAGVWFVFKQFYDKGFVYRDTKVLPFSTGCFTHLSNFEAEHNWKEVTDLCATISVNIMDSSERLLIWTIAPWTLLANLAIIVNPNAKYVKVKLTATDDVYIVSKSRLSFVFPNSAEYSIVEEILGKQLENLRYQPLFIYLSGNEKAFHVYSNECVRDDIGTGVVALSPYFGEDDYRVCLDNGIAIDATLCPVDDSGRFKEDVTEVAGLHISETNEVIIKTLQRLGHLVHSECIKHKKPHCWRSDVPLIDKIASTWFIKVEDLNQKIADNDAQVHWLHCKHRKSAVTDWAIGRNRFWGTPVPIWSSPNGDEIRCIGSIYELTELAGVTSLSDLHREFVDDLLIPSNIAGNPPLRRVPEVFDCWFESAAMPFLQERSQADLIAEGIDQTSGWFYTTSVLSAALDQPPPAKNIFAHGLVLESDGLKISKRKHNHCEPVRIADKYGADALRLYLMSTPLVYGENFSLQEDGARKITEKLIKPLYNIIYALVPHFGKVGWVTYGVISENNYIENIFDLWILSCIESLIQFHNTELTAFRLHSIIPRVVELIELVQNWYIPIRRKSGQNPLDIVTFILFNIVYKLSLILAPFAPFFAEHIYQILYPFVGGYFQRDFVHDSLLPEKSINLINVELEIQITRWRMIIDLVREVRTTRVVPIQYRISELIIVQPAEIYLKENELLNETLMKISNVHKIRTTNDPSEFGATVKVDLKAQCLLIQRMSQSVLQEVTTSIKKLTNKDVENAFRNGSLDVLEYSIPLDDLEVSYVFDKELDKNLAVVDRNDLLVVVRMNKDLEYYEEGTRLEIIKTLQKFKKRSKVYSSEFITVCYSTNDSCLRNAFQKYSTDIGKSTNSLVKYVEKNCEIEEYVMHETIEIKGVPVDVYLIRAN